jgi:hypothetical protein
LGAAHGSARSDSPLSRARPWRPTGGEANNGPNFKTHPSHRLLGNIQPTFHEQIFDGSAELLDDESIEIKFAWNNGGEAVLKVSGSILQQAARCVARPILNLGLLSANARLIVTD